ncbi:MAG: hypothetical protein AAFR16_08315, partial [Pseudomonadota bacterium]
MSREYIDASQSYTALRNQLMKHTTADSKDAIRAGDSGLYVKNKVSRPWFGSGAKRAEKYANAVHAIKEAINTEFAGVVVNGKKLGDYAMSRMGDPSKLTMSDIRKLDGEIVRGLAKWKGGSATQRGIARQTALLLDAARSGSASPSEQKGLAHWRKTAPGLERMTGALRADLRANGL